MDRKTWNALVVATTALGAVAFAVCLLHVWFPVQSACPEMMRMSAPFPLPECRP